MPRSLHKIVAEYERMKKEALRLKKLVNENPNLRHKFRGLKDSIEGKRRFNSPVKPEKSEFIFATILDEFSSDNWSSEFTNITLTLDGWQRELDYFEPDCLMVESAWYGNYNEWAFAFVAPRTHANAREFEKLLSVCREREIPTLFWNKEDPLHFDRFIDVAKLFDIVFTTDANSIERYRDHLGHERIYSLPFAAQPAICNPAYRGDMRDHRPCFAGSYYTSGHGDRAEQMEFMLDALMDQDGVIYDRYFHSEDEKVQMPEKYKPISQPPIPFDEMVNGYKAHSSILNVNTVVDSPTMMSRRVFEILASGTPVISSPSTAIENLLGDVVDVVSSRDEASALMQKYKESPELSDRRGHVGHRRVLKEHTYRRRFLDIREAIADAYPDSAFALPRDSGSESVAISMIIASRRPASIDAIIQNTSRQSHSDCEVILALTPDFSKSDVEKLRSSVRNSVILELPEECTLGEALNRAVEASSGDVLVKMDDDNLYGDEFLADLILPLQYTEAEIIGKECHFTYLEQLDQTLLMFPNKAHRYTSFVAGDAMLFTRDVADRIKFPSKRVGEDSEFLRRATRMGIRIYSTDPYNFSKMRYADPNFHTWEADADKFLKSSRIVGRGKCLNDIFI